MTISAQCRLDDASDKAIGGLSDTHADRRPELYGPVAEWLFKNSSRLALQGAGKWSALWTNWGETMSTEIEEQGIEPRQPAGIEVHSIDWVPNEERHGEVRHLGAIWFVGNISLG